MDKFKALRSSDVFLQFSAYRQVIGQITTNHPPEVSTVVPHFDVAKFVDNHVIKTGLRGLDQIEVEGDPSGLVGITSQARFHGADCYGWQRDLFSLHQAVAFD